MTLRLLAGVAVVAAVAAGLVKRHRKQLEAAGGDVSLGGPKTTLRAHPPNTVPPPGVDPHPPTSGPAIVN